MFSVRVVCSPRIIIMADGEINLWMRGLEGRVLACVHTDVYTNVYLLYTMFLRVRLKFFDNFPSSFGTLTIRVVNIEYRYRYYRRYI